MKNKIKQVHKIRLKIEEKVTKNLLKKTSVKNLLKKECTTKTTKETLLKKD